MNKFINNPSRTGENPQRHKMAAEKNASADLSPLAPSPAQLSPARPSPALLPGSVAWLGGGTVNLAHYLGGMPLNLADSPPPKEFRSEMPIKLPPLPSNPESFGKVLFDQKGTLASPFSTHRLPPPVPPTPAAPPEPPSASPFVPIKPEPLEVAIVIPKKVSPKLKIAPIPRHAVLRSAPLANRKSPTSETSPEEISEKDRRDKNTLPSNTNADVDLANLPAVANDLANAATGHTDVFANFETAPMNDAAFGGAPLNPLDALIVSQRPETDEKPAGEEENDFANNDFWNRTDQDDDVRPINPTDILNPPGWGISDPG